MNQTTESFLKIESVFHEALESPAEARSALIAERCGGDEELIAEVHALINASEAEEQITSSRRREPGADKESLPERRRVGPYELERLLGRGGMGAVYLAHRADGQFDQQVAIKLIDLPLATDLFRERFRLERQILAGLQHPYIARLLDGGVTAEGDLYLAMEYVDGTPINRFCNEKQLSQAQRLTLFRGVCEAVQFAHQNLVVHRDLKPDNILVVEDATPRLLDFGTAKLVSPSIDKPESDLTRQGFQSFTPQYASPEQVLGTPITTASDTYSLGVLLYLLLTDTLPYEFKELTTAEMIRVICHEPPRSPIMAKALNQHGFNHRASNSRLDPDLEAILSKALRKEPLERYRTAEQLASDIQFFLDGRPVEARRGTFRYRAAKFIRRNRLAIAATVVLAATLAAGVAGVLWQARVANQERRKAESRAADLRQLSNSLLSELDEAIKNLPGSTGVQKLLVTRVLEHLDRMAQDAQGDRQTQLDLIDAYTRLGNIQGNGYDQNLGDPVGGLASLGKALAIAQPLASGSTDPEVIRAFTSADQSRSEILFLTGQTQQAVAAMKAAVKSFDTLIADLHTPVALIGEAAAANGTLGDELGQPGTPSLGDRQGAIFWYKRAIELDYRALKIDPNFLRCRRGIAIMELKLGTVEIETDPAQALKDFQTSMQRVDLLPQDQQSTMFVSRLRANLLRKEANSLTELGEYSAAIPLYTQALHEQQKILAADPQDLRALADVEIDLEDEATSYQYAADPALWEQNPPTLAQRMQSLRSAESILTGAFPDLAKMVQRDPANASWKSLQAAVQVQTGNIRLMLKDGNGSEALSNNGLATFKNLAKNDQASPSVLDQAAEAFLHVLPTQLRDPHFALICAQREIASSKSRPPTRLLSLAQAYDAAGQFENARVTAKEALGLLPAPRVGEPRSRIRKLLEIEARAATNP